MSPAARPARSGSPTGNCRCCAARSRNSAGGFGGDYYGTGGALRISGPLTGSSIVNCTISGNTTYGSSPTGGAVRGAGLDLQVFSGGRLDIVNTTITNNRAGVGATHGHGGGIFYDRGGADSTHRVFFTNTIIAGNFASTMYPDIDADSPRIVSDGHNLIGVRDGWTSAAGVVNSSGDLVGTAANPLDPRLAALANNGGLTMTHKPLLVSPVINAGDASALTFGNTSDQIGTARDEWAGPDIGAVERIARPYFTSAAPRNVYLDAGESFTYNATASHEEPGWFVTFSLTSAPSWLTLVDDGSNGDCTATLAGTADATPGTYTIILSVTTGVATTEQSFVLHVAQENVAPTITSTPLLTATADTKYSYKLIGHDGNGDRLDFSAVTLPAWLTLHDHGDGTATLYGDPTNANAGVNAVSIQVSDGHLASLQAFNITVARFNHTPTMTGPQMPTATAFQFYTATVSAADIDGDALTLSGTLLPAWLTIVDNRDGTATISGTPTNAHAGQAQVGVKASDGSANMTRHFFFNVTYVNRAPSFVTTELPNGFRQLGYSADVSATDPDSADKLTITALTKPAWMTVTSNGNGTATLSGTPNVAPGVYSFTLRVSDGKLTADRNFTITLPNRAPQITLVSGQQGAAADQAFTANLVAEDLDLDTVTIAPVSLPSWLQFAATGIGTCRLQGTPTNAYAGDNTVVLRLSDGTNTVERTIVIPVAYVNHAPTIGASTMTVNAESHFTSTFFSLDVDGDPLTVTATGNPAWLTVTANADGSMTFAGMANNADAGHDHLHRARQ